MRGMGWAHEWKIAAGLSRCPEGREERREERHGTRKLEMFLECSLESFFVDKYTFFLPI